ncbi:MAG: hypothetical protein RSF40_10270 [Oscillospiraceae bacterium]
MQKKGFKELFNQMISYANSKLLIFIFWAAAFSFFEGTYIISTSFIISSYFFCIFNWVVFEKSWDLKIIRNLPFLVKEIILFPFCLTGFLIIYGMFLKETTVIIAYIIFFSLIYFSLSFVYFIKFIITKKQCNDLLLKIKKGNNENEQK